MSRDKEIEHALRQYQEGIKQEANAEIIYAHYSDWIYNYLRRKGARHGTAEDLAQESLIKVIHSIWRFRFECKFDTYVFRIAINQWLKHQRSRKTHVSIDDPEVQEEQFEELEDPALSPEDDVLTEEHKDIVRQAILELAPRQRECIELFYYQDRSLRDIAQITGKAISTTGANLFFGRKNLKKSIADYLSKGGGSPGGSDESETESSSTGSSSTGSSSSESSSKEETCSKEM